MMRRKLTCLAVVSATMMMLAEPVAGRVGCDMNVASTLDTLQTDTLREVVVRADTGIHIPLSGSLIKDAHRKDYSPNAILQRLAPTLHDQIMHPFGFKERKQNRKRKKVNKILRDYDMIDRDPLQMLLDSIAKEQGYDQNR